MTYFFCGKWQPSSGDLQYISGVIETRRIETPEEYHAVRDRVAKEARVDPAIFIMTALNPL